MKESMGVTPAFERAVYEVVAQIPEGKVATYGQVAEMAGMLGAGQEVGHIMSRVKAEQASPDGTLPGIVPLPCHRVVNRTGVLSPAFAFGGQWRQRAMLEEEGVLFTGDGRIDMVRHQWNENEQLTL